MPSFEPYPPHLTLSQREQANTEREEQLLQRIEEWNNFVKPAIERFDQYQQFMNTKYNELIEVAQRLYERECELNKREAAASHQPVQTVPPIALVAHEPAPPIPLHPPPSAHLESIKRMLQSTIEEAQAKLNEEVKAKFDAKEAKKVGRKRKRTTAEATLRIPQEVDVDVEKFNSPELNHLDSWKPIMRLPFFLPRAYREFLPIKVGSVNVKAELVPIVVDGVTQYVVCVNNLFSEEGLNVFTHKTNLRKYTKVLEPFKDFVKISVYHCTVQQQQEYFRQATLAGETIHANKYKGAAIVLCLSGRGLFKMLNMLEHLIEHVSVVDELRVLAVNKLCWSFQPASYEADVQAMSKVLEPLQPFQPVNSVQPIQPLVFDPLVDDEPDFLCYE